VGQAALEKPNGINREAGIETLVTPATKPDVVADAGLGVFL